MFSVSTHFRMKVLFYYNRAASAIPHSSFIRGPNIPVDFLTFIFALCTFESVVNLAKLWVNAAHYVVK